MIERVILSAGAMLIFSVSFQIDQMPEGEIILLIKYYILFFKKKTAFIVFSCIKDLIFIYTASYGDVGSVENVVLVVTPCISRRA